MSLFGLELTRPARTHVVHDCGSQVFFVFLEVLFMLGYRPALHRKLQNKTGVVSAESLTGTSMSCTDYSLPRGQLVAQFRKEQAAKAKAR